MNDRDPATDLAKITLAFVAAVAFLFCLACCAGRRAHRPLPRPSILGPAWRPRARAKRPPPAPVTDASYGTLWGGPRP